MDKPIGSSASRTDTRVVHRNGDNSPPYMQLSPCLDSTVGSTKVCTIILLSYEDLRLPIDIF